MDDSLWRPSHVTAKTELLSFASLPAASHLPCGRDLSCYARAYGTRASRLLSQLRGTLDSLTADFARGFYEELCSSEAIAKVIARLDESELEHLKVKQTRHLAMLVSPNLTVNEHFEAARRVGRVHEMVGIDHPSLLEAYHYYQRRVLGVLPRSGLDAAKQDCLAKTLLQRIMLDIEAQTVSRYDSDLATISAISELERAIQDAHTLTDLLQAATRVLASLDGMLACLICRPDSLGNLQVEAVGGAGGRAYTAAMQTGRIPLMQIDPDLVNGQGPSSQAWQSGEIVLCHAYHLEPTLQAWRDIGTKLGFRSCASVPLLDEGGRPFAMLIAYSRWTGYFSASHRRNLLSYVQQALNRSIVQFEQRAPLPLHARLRYQGLLKEGAVTMLYQPVIDLRTGELQYVEALARLRGADASLISPAAFLPAFGRSDLLRLFRIGLQQVCRDSDQWASAGLSPLVSINIPSEELADSAYREALFEILHSNHFPPERLQLEVLESRDPMDIDRRDARIAELRRAGIRIVQDDLGSGHSSLLRMDHIPFDAVKIDQGFVRSAIDDPERALKFIFHLTLLVHGFGIPVTVEGLEDRALIEAVAILGADCGQGFGIAKPMRSEQIPGWSKQFVFDIDPRSPGTPLGALAGFLLSDHERKMVKQWPDLVEYLGAFPCLLHAYIDRHMLRGSSLHVLLEENLRSPPSDNESSAYQRTRRALVAELADAWVRSKVCTKHSNAA